MVTRLKELNAEDWMVIITRWAVIGYCFTAVGWTLLAGVRLMLEAL